MNICERSFRLYGDQALKSKCVYVKGGGLPMTSSSYEIQSLECGSSSRISPYDLSIDGLISGNLHKECQGEQDPLKACSHDAIFLYPAPFKFTSS